jgi:hypothetical protein
MVEQKSESVFTKILDCRKKLIAHVDMLQRERERERERQAGA